MSEKTRRPRLMVINEPDGRRFSKALALEIGRDHAEVFLQIEFLMTLSTTPIINDRLWTRDSIARLQELQFPYWGKSFISDTPSPDRAVPASASLKKYKSRRSWIRAISTIGAETPPPGTRSILTESPP